MKNGRLKLNVSKIKMISVGWGKQFKEFAFTVPPYLDISACRQGVFLDSGLMPSSHKAVSVSCLLYSPTGLEILSQALNLDRARSMILLQMSCQLVFG